MNKQPCYHRVVFLFTGIDREFTEQDLLDVVKKGLGKDATGVVVEEFDEPEWGDPSDLV